MIDLSSILSIVNLLLILSGIVAGRVVLKSSVAKAESEVQTRLQDMLSAENEVQRSRIQRLEAENKRQSRLIQLIITTLKKLHGIELDIEEEIITIRSPNGSVSRVSTDIV